MQHGLSISPRALIYVIATRTGPCSSPVITDPLFYLVAIPAVILLGLGKGGFAGLGMISVPLLTLRVPILQAAAIILPLLVTQDAISAWTYRRAWSAWNLKVLIPGSIIGMGAGTLFASYVSNAAIEVAGGTIGLSFVVYRWIGRWLWPHLIRAAEKPKQPHALAGVFWGSLAGFMSLLINVGAPPYQIHILPQRLDKLTFVGTTVHVLCLHESDEDRPLFFARPVFVAQFRNVDGALAAGGGGELPRHLAGAANADRAVLPHHLSVDVFDLGGADLAGLAGSGARRVTNHSPFAIRPPTAFG